jgi:rubrerythrin
MKDRTRFNIEAALAGEALTALRYQLFADRARQEGPGRRAPCGELAGRAGLVGSTRENLRAAIAGEVSEQRSLYARFAAQARQDGEDAVATSLESLGGDEPSHLDALREALDELEISELEVVR